MKNEYAIEIHDLTKEIDRKAILSGITMNVKKGEIYGFLGANGAGKTTLMKTIYGILKPTSGSICILGNELTENNCSVFSKMGSLIEIPVFYHNFSAYKNLELHCGYMGAQYIQNIEKVLDMTGIRNQGDKPVKEFSLGMKQRLALARAILTNPELLILDEPINGLDPQGIIEIRELLLQINRENGTTILISSHILSEMAKIADRIGVIDKGIILKEISMTEIVDKGIELESYYLELLKGGSAL
ncbi:ABC transporter ATP-binding protein [Clostridium sporogenes]|uniref:ABC transporter ATP-binding protein n=1 Tax=Clostridium sporogenes TaxID=1509 RepID=UPI0013CF4720|nr:ATP-binding cassette domain-containing protein [Clostridium sporogenes]NFP93060.1 ATP-binding cassette domain-containing protein [Clostridium sporogenes]